MKYYCKVNFRKYTMTVNFHCIAYLYMWSRPQITHKPPLTLNAPWFLREISTTNSSSLHVNTSAATWVVWLASNEALALDIFSLSLALTFSLSLSPFDGLPSRGGLTKQCHLACKTGVRCSCLHLQTPAKPVKSASPWWYTARMAVCLLYTTRDLTVCMGNYVSGTSLITLWAIL